MKNFLLLSDLHVGSLAGLWPEGFEHEIQGSAGEIQQYVLNGTQRKLWEHWKKMLRTDAKKADAILINGDLCDGTHRKSEGMYTVTTDLAVQSEACVELVETLPSVPTYITQGTYYHSVENRPIEQYVAEQTGATYAPDMVIEECGIRMYARHTIGASNSTWQYMTTAPARDHMLLYLNRAQDKYGEIDAAIFSHRHQFVAAEYGSGIALVTPCWQSRTAYAIKKGIVGMPDVGWITLRIDNRRSIAIDRNNIINVERPCKVVGSKIDRPRRGKK